MAKIKFTTNKRDSQSKQLREKMELIALGIAEQILTGKSTLPGAEELSEAQSALKTLTQYYGAVNKVEVPDLEGDAFDAYRAEVAAPVGGGNPGDSDGDSNSAGASKDGGAPVVNLAEVLRDRASAGNEIPTDKSKE
jgi:hypothetical protein